VSIFLFWQSVRKKFLKEKGVIEDEIKKVFITCFNLCSELYAADDRLWDERFR